MGRIAAALAIVFAALTAALPVEAQQAAPAANGSCNSGDFCGWRHDSMGGGILDTPYAMATYVGYGFYASGIGLNDEVSSVRNRFNSYAVRLHIDSYYGGSSRCFPRQMPSFTNINTTIYNDETSSHRGIGATCT